MSVWIFGYGSLIWKHDFPFEVMIPCYVKGYRRVFYQGSTDHRGVPGSPGRVVTLIPASDGSVSGVAFRLPSDSAGRTLEALDFREKGGYERVEIEAFDLDTHAKIRADDDVPAVLITYIASESNDEYLGPADDKDIAAQIASSVGPSGPNAEYLLKLADGLRVLKADDEHVFRLEAIVKELLSAK